MSPDVILRKDRLLQPEGSPTESARDPPICERPPVAEQWMGDRDEG